MILKKLLKWIGLDKEDQKPVNTELTFNQYQEKSKETVIFPEYGKLEGVLYSALEINDEAGEVAGKVKKVIRDNNGVLTEEKAEQIALELGDVMYGVAILADQLGFRFEDVAKANLGKLQDRAMRNQIQGDGDNR